MVDVPTISPLDPNEIGVPEIVTPGAFVARVVPAMTTALGRTVTGWPAAIITDADGCEVGNARARVLVPIWSADGPRDTIAPPTVITGWPAFKVCPAAMRRLEESVRVSLPTVKYET